jgi:hypothetical protein
MAATAPRPMLLELAETRFDQDIWPAEEKLFASTANGKDADCTGLPEKDRFIRGNRLSW